MYDSCMNRGGLEWTNIKKVLTVDDDGDRALVLQQNDESRPRHQIR
jgi:hypothetical protein